MVSVTFLTVPSVCGQLKVINISKVNDGGLRVGVLSSC